MRYIIYGLIVLLAVLHQDYWFRDDDRTLVFGFVPVSLAYHVGVSIAACVLWGLACRYCWPTTLNGNELPAASSPSPVDTGDGSHH